MPDYPTVLYPTIVSGFVSGRRLRLESLDLTEMFIIPEMLSELRTQPSLAGLWYEDGGYRLENVSAISIDGKLWGVTHAQKYSNYGWLKAEPDCYHWWSFLKLQQKRADGTWIPETEEGWYFRKSRKLFKFRCWRWDVPGTVIDGALRHWIDSGGRFGQHWD